MLAHTGTPYMSIECTTFDISLLLAFVAALTLGKILFRFWAALFAFSHVDLACTVNLTFWSSVIPIYLISWPALI